MELLSHALQVAHTIADPHTKAWPLRGIAQVYAKAGDYERALQVAHTTAEANTKAWALWGIALAYTKAGDYDRALQLAHTIAEANAKASALQGIAEAYVEAGQKAKALELLSHALPVAHTIAEAVYKASALHTIAQTYAKAGDYDHALQVIATIEDAHAKAAILAQIVYTCAQDEQKEHSGTKRILHGVLRAVISLSDPGAHERLKPEVAILGKWQNINSNETAEFFKDGTVNFISDGSPMGGDYKIVDDTHVRLHPGGFGGLAGPMVWKFAVSGEQLTLNLPDGKVAMYRRVR